MKELINKFLENFGFYKFMGNDIYNWDRRKTNLRQTSDLLDSIYKYISNECARFVFMEVPTEFENLKYSANEIETRQEFYKRVFERLSQNGKVVFSWRLGIIFEEYELYTENGNFYYKTEFGVTEASEVIDLNDDRFALVNISKQLFNKLLSLDDETLNGKRPKYSIKPLMELRPEDLQKEISKLFIADEHGAIIIDDSVLDFKILDAIDKAANDEQEKIENKIFRLFSINDEILKNQAGKESLDVFRYNVVEQFISLLEEAFKMKIDSNIELLPEYSARLTDERVTKLGQLGLITINEGRKTSGFDSLGEAGDTLIENWNQKGETSNNEMEKK